MDFLAPLFLAGAAAVALPIIFHLIRKTTKEKTIFSSLMFLFPTPPKVTRRSRLDNILLLLLRCGVLCLLALGFARPYLVRPSNGNANSGAGKKMIVLVDTSASVRRDNLWAQERERVSDLLQRLGPSDEAALVAFNDHSTEVFGFEEWRRTPIQDRRAVVLARLEALAPTWRGTHLGNALLNAIEGLVQETRGDGGSAGTARLNNTAREIVVVSDLQQGSRLDGLQGFEWPKGIKVRIEQVKARRPSNAGIHLLEERDDAATTSDLNRRIRVANSSDSKKEQFKIAWVGGTNSPLETYVPPGQSRILQLPPGSPGQGQLLMTGDEQDFDNKLYWVGARQSQINVPYLGMETEEDAVQPLFYLKRAFQQTARQDVRLTNQITTNAPLTIVSGPLGTARPAGSMLVVLKSCAAATILSELLNIPSIACEEATDQKYSLLAEIDFTHPLFKPFADPRFSDFTKIHFWKHRRIDAQQIPNTRVLARFDNGDPALLEVPRGRDKILILTSGWHPADSQLALSSKFVPLLYSLLEYSSNERPLHLQFEVGQTLPPEFGSPRE
ncbi:MAG TPA: BatA domain-containing protein, partial [Verrucomicrobiae bacterium]|nr:BatA domain-containing protein [Verrucomicrobiae bacterium]